MVSTIYITNVEVWEYGFSKAVWILCSRNTPDRLLFDIYILKVLLLNVIVIDRKLNSLKDVVYKMTISEFYKIIFPNQKDINQKYGLKHDQLSIDEKYLIRISEYLKNIENEKEREKHFKDIISKPNIENGKVYEFLVYSWLQKKKINFEEQVSISSDECLKKNDYDADGKFDGIVFDVKKFGISFPLYDTFRAKLQEKIPDYFITIGGSKNLDTKTIEKELISKTSQWVERLLSEESKLYKDYMLRDAGLGIEIRAHNKKNSGGIYTSFSELDITQWAEENELYFFRHASQFCCNTPYMIICPFLPRDFPFGSKDETLIYYAFRYLCRRMFMNVIKRKDRLLRDACDGHAKDYVTLETAARKLSAVMFLDISEEWEYSNCRCWIYKNPNADLPIPNYIMHSKFELLGAHIDDFKYDNY